MTQLGLKMQQLYEEDIVLWAEKTGEQLRNKKIENLDWEHLAEEIEELGSEQKHKVNSYLKQLLLHLLLYQYWLTERESCARGWRTEITNFRDELEELFESKTLYNYFLQRINDIYFKARRLAIQKTGLAAATFPKQCPFAVEQMLDFEFFPE